MAVKYDDAMGIDTMRLKSELTGRRRGMRWIRRVERKGRARKKNKDELSNEGEKEECE